MCNFEGEERLSECQNVVKPLKKVEEDKDDDFHGFYRFDCPYCDFIGFDQIEIGQQQIRVINCYGPQENETRSKVKNLTIVDTYDRFVEGRDQI